MTSIQLPSSFFTKTAGTRLSWLGMAGAIIHARGTVVLIDPLLSAVEQDGHTVSEAGFALDDFLLPITAGELQRVDMVCYTHADDDHIGRITAQTLAANTHCRFLAPPPVARILIAAGIPEERITIARDFDYVPVGALTITVTPALHDWQEVNPWQRGDCCGYLLRTPDGSIWHPGDTRLIDELLDFKEVDVLFFDVADVVSHLGPTGSARLAAACGAKVLIPYHYWTFGQSPGTFADFDPQQLADSTAGLQANMMALQPGEVLELPV